jgi:hypothetical protein
MTKLGADVSACAEMLACPFFSVDPRKLLLFTQELLSKKLSTFAFSRRTIADAEKDREKD